MNVCEYNGAETEEANSEKDENNGGEQRCTEQEISKGGTGRVLEAVEATDVNKQLMQAKQTATAEQEQQQQTQNQGSQEQQQE